MVLVFAGLAVFLSYYWLQTAEIPIEVASVDADLFEESSAAFSPMEQQVMPSTFALPVSVITFTVGLMCFLGYFALVLYGGVGMTALPIDLIVSYQIRPVFVRIWVKLAQFLGGDAKEDQVEAAGEGVPGVRVAAEGDGEGPEVLDGVVLEALEVEPSGEGVHEAAEGRAAAGGGVRDFSDGDGHPSVQPVRVHSEAAARSGAGTGNCGVVDPLGAVHDDSNKRKALPPVFEPAVHRAGCVQRELRVGFLFWAVHAVPVVEHDEGEHCV